MTHSTSNPPHLTASKSKQPQFTSTHIWTESSKKKNSATLCGSHKVLSIYLTLGHMTQGTGPFQNVINVVYLKEYFEESYWKLILTKYP